MDSNKSSTVSSEQFSSRAVGARKLRIRWSAQHGLEQWRFLWRRADGWVETAPSHKTWLAIKRALKKAGIQFIDENGGGPGLRLKKPQ